MKFTKLLHDLSTTDTYIAGGKGASLGEMLQAGVPVPGGFVVLSSTFEYFIAQTNVHTQITAILDTVRLDAVHTIESAAEQIQSLILNASMPAEIEEEIHEKFQNLDTEFVAVRSSATAEDGADHAWAGQLDSYLNTTAATLIDHVKRCWASLFTPRAIFYRFEKGLQKEHISVAVVVQKMVQSEKSGIAFSVHPVTQDPDQLIIEAGFGLGEAIVSGAITPDSYVVRKSALDVEDIQVHTQTKALYKSTGGGNEWKDLAEEGKNQVLSTQEIITVSQLIMAVENHYGFPCDIERAYENGEFFIVQSRPITTLQKQQIKEASKEEPKEDKVLTKLFETQISLSERYEEIGDEGKDIFRKEDNSKRDRLKTLNEIIGVPYDKPTQFPASDLSDRTEILTKFLEEHGHELCALRLIPQDESLPKLRMRGKSVQEVMKRYDEQHVNPDVYIADFVPHSDRPIWCTSFVITDKGVIGEAVWGGPHILTQGFYEDIKILTFFYNFENWKTNYEDEKLLKHIQGVINLLLVKDDNVQKKLQEDLQSAFFHDHLGGYFEAVYTEDFGLHFLDYNRLLGNVFAGYTPTIVDSSTTAELLYGQVAYAGTVRGKIYKDVVPHGAKDAILVCTMTTPAHIASMRNAVGIITDKGGILSHAAIISRELHIPCIVGTGNATQRLEQGDMIEMNADTGSVRKIS